jgi:glycosyltransferase involved in cell wall biosynthesis
MRAIIVSHLYADPANRGKLRSLAGLGVTLSVAVPDRWTAANGTVQRTDGSDDAGVRIVPIGVRGQPESPERLTWNAKAIRRLLDDFSPEVLHIEEEPWSQPAAVGIGLGRKLGIRTVLSTAESLPRGYSIAQKFRRERSLRHATGLIASNQLAWALASRRRAAAAPKLVLPQLGVSPPADPARIPQPAFGIGFFGRLVPERGLDLLFRACVGLAGKWTLTVVGTGPSQEELEGLAQRLGLSARVAWLGALPREAAADVWPRLDCVVLPSRTTQQWVLGVGRAALYAMAHGVTVVGSDSGALRELVGDAGRIVPEEDVPALTAALQELYADRSQCDRLGAAGRRRVLEHFSDDAIAGKTLDFWRSLVPASG